ncbi:hypothetical protein [Bacillus massiliglaciei]|uniref:hypothetical protein n=1 Tax=Bacillus massiliglaciei TaxID=1816693 RepID=UPI000DA605B7|nr:hypothetical protein [Bacillus massiliglaciei]
MTDRHSFKNDKTVSEANDGTYSYPDSPEEGYSGNTGKAVQPNREESIKNAPLNHDTYNFTKEH